MQKLRKILSITVTAAALAAFMLATLAACSPLSTGDVPHGYAKVRVAAPSGRAITDEERQNSRMEYYFNDRKSESNETVAQVGSVLRIKVVAIDARNGRQVATAEKTITVAPGMNNVSVLLHEDRGAQPTSPSPPSPAIEYVSVTFNQGFVYTNSVSQPQNTWQDMMGASLPGGGQREKNSGVSQSDEPRASGYVFKGWVENSQMPNGDAPDAQNFTYVHTYTDDTALYAIWEQLEPDSHEVKFETGAGSDSVSGMPTNTQKQSTTQVTWTETPTRAGYEFTGWNASVSGVSVTQQGNSWTFMMPDSPVTLTAQWNVITYTLSYEANDGQATPAQTETFTVAAGGANVTLKAANTFTRTGYTFANWNAGGSNSYNPSASVAKTSLIALAAGNGTNRTITITAVWTPIQYKITYSNTNGGTGSASTTGATTSFNIETQNITLATEGTLEKIAYQFEGWETADGTDVNNMNASQLIALITSGDTLALQVKWIDGKRTALYPDGTLIINELPTARRQDTPTAVYAAMKDNGSNYVFSSLNDVMWYTDRDSITSVEIGSYISPTSTKYWFYGLSKCTSITLTNLDTSNVTNMQEMFSYCSSLTTLSFGNNFNTSNVTNMQYMFSYCSSLTTLSFGNNFNTSNVTDMQQMFYRCSGLTSLDLSNFDPSNVTSMYAMFYSCSGLTSLNLSNFNTSNVKNMYNMFYSCSGLTSLDLSKFDTSNVTNMQKMFYGCSELTSLDLSKFDTSNVTEMQQMFSNCSKLTTLSFGNNFNTSNVKNMYNMFSACSGLTSLDLSKFDTSNVTSIYSMFSSCTNLATIYASNAFVTYKVTSDSNKANMFKDCTALRGGSGTAYDANNPTDTTYARIDNPPDAPGYFTQKP